MYMDTLVGEKGVKTDIEYQIRFRPRVARIAAWINLSQTKLSTSVYMNAYQYSLIFNQNNHAFNLQIMFLPATAKQKEINSISQNNISVDMILDVLRTNYVERNTYMEPDEIKWCESSLSASC